MRRFALAMLLLAPQDDAKLKEALDNLNSNSIETRDAATTFLLEAATARPRRSTRCPWGGARSTSPSSRRA